MYNKIFAVVGSRININQHGFTPGTSTVTNLSAFSDFLLNNIKGGQVDVIYT